MASWPEIRETLERYEGRRVLRLSDEVLEVTVLVIDDRVGVTADGADAHLERKVNLRRGEIPRKDGGPGEEFVVIEAHIGAVGGVDLMSAVGQAGQFDHCLLGYVQGDHRGVLTVGTRLPAALLDVRNPVPFLSLLRTIARTAVGVMTELGPEGGLFAYRTEQIRRSAWNYLRRVIEDDDSITVWRDLGHGFFFWIDGLKDPGRRLSLLICENNRGPGEHYFSLEIRLGPIQDVDLRRAAEAAASTTGGLVCHDGFVSIRVSQHVTALTDETLVASVIQLVDAAEQYLDGWAPR
jgi:hypothetical protein